MFSNFPFLSGQRNGYSAIPSVIPANNRKISASLDGVLKNWENRDEIKCQNPNSSNPSAYYYSDSQQPEGILESGKRFFAHLIDSEARALHRDGINAAVKELKNQSALPTKGTIVAEDFKMRTRLGQPLSVGALKRSIARFTSQVPQQEPPQSTQSAATPANPCPSSPFSIFGKARNPKNREPVLRTLTTGLSFSNPLAGKNGYAPIPEDQDSKKSPQKLSTRQGSSSASYQKTFSGEDRKPLTSADFPPAEDGISPLQSSSGALERYTTQRAKQRKSSALGQNFSSPSQNSYNQRGFDV
ncbi:MAG: hypothetical protein NT164_04965 [Verrucomicrobiae bacterium]|nr:hypothetical protein [Verrucomicrobiae bacterium]